ncbi:MAG TPA: flagellar filament capping protein FliD [Rhodocyclaceae bacterium]|nr:flagellar filament capping protein FliD [Rhodocyclaceae bacterium]
MSVNGINASDLAALLNPRATGNSATGSTTGASFASTLAIQVATMQSQTLNSLVNTVTGTGQTSNNATNLLDQLTGSSSLGSVGGLSSTGRNTSLFDPESAYQMMSFINKQDVVFKAQYSELSNMGTYVSQLQQSATGLESISVSTSNTDLKSQLQQFVTQYNDWVKKFDGDMASGGALNNVQAAEESRYELEQSVNNMFNGAADGFNGLPSLGITIDATTHLAKIDNAQLDAALASNKQGVVNTVQQFAGNFAKSAELLTSAGNFISNRLNNLSGAIQYIGSNESALQKEFGTGDSYKPTGAIAQAAAAYDESHKA